MRTVESTEADIASERASRRSFPPLLPLFCAVLSSQLPLGSILFVSAEEEEEDNDDDADDDESCSSSMR